MCIFALNFYIVAMRIKSIEIINFKGFQHECRTFKSNLTVVIGNNTAGKTSLLKALQVGLGAYLQCLEKLPSAAQYRRNFSIHDRFMAFDPLEKDYVPNAERTKISIDADFFVTDAIEDTMPQFTPKEVAWHREFTGNSTTHNRKCVGELMEAVEGMEVKRYQQHDGAVYPLVLSFGAKRTSDAQLKVTSKIKERASRLEKAYKFALHDKVDFDGAMEWLSRYDKNVKDGKEFAGTREAFFEALQTAIPALSEVDFDHGEIEAVVTVSGHAPARHHFSYMSDGMQSMINIVAEIAHRCIELNGCLGRNAVKKTPGVVMIDEIDLYLHPHWQKHVLQDLTEAFPMIQFIVSTHSPFIVQSLQKDQLISFDDGVMTSGEPYRESLEDITAERMGLGQEIRSKRFQEMQEMAASYFHSIQNGEEDKSLLERLRSIEAHFSDNPAYVALLQSEYNTKEHSR